MNTRNRCPSNRAEIAETGDDERMDMRRTTVDPTTTEVIQAPQLSAIAVLSKTLPQVRWALLAAHPELSNCSDLGSCHDTTPETWVADALLNQFSALESGLVRYQEALLLDRQWRLVPRYSDDEDDQVF